MTIIELVWMVTLSIAMVLVAVDMFVAWLGSSVSGGDSEIWKRVVQAIVLQWIALLSQALILSVALTGKG